MVKKRVEITTDTDGSDKFLLQVKYFLCPWKTVDYTFLESKAMNFLVPPKPKEKRYIYPPTEITGTTAEGPM